MKEQYHIICPHCDKEMEDSADWGYPDTDWEEDAQCPYCEKEFRWRRTLHHCTYSVEKKEPGDLEPDYFGKILPEGERLCLGCGKIHRTDADCPRDENALDEGLRSPASATNRLSEPVRTWRPTLAPGQQKMLDWLAAKLATDPELADIFAAACRKGGYSD